MLRVMFKISDPDPRPMIWPIELPYWVTGETGDGKATLVAYVKDTKTLMKQWPDAEDISAEEVGGIEFSPRRPRPDWYKGAGITSR